MLVMMNTDDLVEKIFLSMFVELFCLLSKTITPRTVEVCFLRGIFPLSKLVNSHNQHSNNTEYTSPEWSDGGIRNLSARPADGSPSVFQHLLPLKVT